MTLADAEGTFNGSPFITVPTLTNLASGQTATVNVQFRNASKAAINFVPVIYLGSFE